MFFLGWHEIRQTLFESLPKGVVEFGKKFDRYSDEGNAGVHVHFKVCCTPFGPSVKVHVSEGPFVKRMTLGKLRDS